MRGLFITIEGVEGSGKSTQSKILADALKKHNLEVILTREPGGPPVSEAIREILLNKEYMEMLPETELLLYMASRAQHTGEWIIPALEKGNIVISDRYNDSSLAYQGAARNISLEKIYPIQEYATYSIKPDITFIIDLDPEIGLLRIPKNKADRLELESLEFHKKVRDGFLNLIKKDEDRYILIDGLKTIDEISKKIKSIVFSNLKRLGIYRENK